MAAGGVGSVLWPSERDRFQRTRELKSLLAPRSEVYRADFNVPSHSRNQPFLSARGRQALWESIAQRPDVLEFNAAAPADDLHALIHPLFCLGNEFHG